MQVEQFSYLVTHVQFVFFYEKLKKYIYYKTNKC